MPCLWWCLLLLYYMRVFDTNTPVGTIPSLRVAFSLGLSIPNLQVTFSLRALMLRLVASLAHNAFLLTSLECSYAVSDSCMLSWHRHERLALYASFAPACLALLVWSLAIIACHVLLLCLCACLVLTLLQVLTRPYGLQLSGRIDRQVSQPRLIGGASSQHR